ncbi:MAG: DUF1643 domain-containing protein [Paracoccaceae bacterium]
MEIRHGEWRGLPSSAAFSADGRHRFRLTRRLGAGPAVVFVMLNPSRATETGTDATVSGCVNRARGWGSGLVTVVNLFSFISPDPRALPGHPGRHDAANDAAVLDAARRAELRIAAWGRDRRFRDRAAAVAAMLTCEGLALHCLAVTKAGAPRHPRGLSAGLAPRPWPCGTDPEKSRQMRRFIAR